MGFADLHIHTIFSHDATGSIPAILNYVALNTKLSIIAITDHDTIRGNRQAVDLAPQYGLEVIPGCEVSTADGHLLALFIDHPVPAGLSLGETALRVADQGGICVIPHPEARGTSSVRVDILTQVLQDPKIAESIVGIESYNGGLVYTRSNLSSASLAQKLNLASCGNSDSHILETIGQGSTEFVGHTAQDLRAALLNRSTRMHLGIGMTGARALRHWAPRFLLRKLGWVAWNAGPQQPTRFVRLNQAI
jgi:hypothetical protein